MGYRRYSNFSWFSNRNRHFDVSEEIKKLNHEYIVQFVKAKSGSRNVSLSIKHNDETWVDVNGHEQLPLASTVKIILAIEYAQQAAEGKIDPQKEVKLKELDKFYIPKTDGDAHEAWITQLKKTKRQIVFHYAR
ncbi:serine hydrolase [Bacillus sonorensis]|nr:serine hydrolase [Bacillus sonorensis]